MSIYIDADAFARWEKGVFDLPAFMEERGDEFFAFPATVWQQLTVGVFAWSSDRAVKRNRSLLILGAVPVVAFSRAHAYGPPSSPQNSNYGKSASPISK